jgi:hypothetical protein
MAFARSLERQVSGSAILPLNGDSEAQVALSVAWPEPLSAPVRDLWAVDQVQAIPPSCGQPR